MRNASNFHPDVINFKLAPDDTLVVASYKSYGEHISKQVQDSYSLTVENMNGEKVTNGETLRNYLRSAKKSTSGHARSWHITDSGICPQTKHHLPAKLDTITPLTLLEYQHI
jgi:hypothetical protein